VGFGLAAGAVDHARAKHGFGVDLADEVDREGVVGVEKLEGRVVVNDREVAAVTAAPGYRDNFARELIFAGTGNDPAFDKAGGAGGDEFGMHAEVLFAVEDAELDHFAERITNTKLDTVTILDDFGKIGGDLFVLAGGLQGREACTWRRGRDDRGKTRPDGGFQERFWR